MADLKITSGGKDIYQGKSGSVIDNLLSKMAETIEPWNYTEKDVPTLSRCANRRYSDETFKNYRLRLKEQAKIIKKINRGILVWDSSPMGTSKKGNTYKK